jgi:hypothetical protein
MGWPACDSGIQCKEIKSDNKNKHPNGATITLSYLFDLTIHTSNRHHTPKLNYSTFIMSLLSSIFGGTAEKKEAKSTPTSGLFDKQTIHVPERLHAANKHAQSVPEEENSAVTERTSAPKRKLDDVSTAEFDAASAAAAESKATRKPSRRLVFWLYSTRPQTLQIIQNLRTRS